jgi:hypothetical protein
MLAAATIIVVTATIPASGRVQLRHVKHQRHTRCVQRHRRDRRRGRLRVRRGAVLMRAMSVEAVKE